MDLSFVYGMYTVAHHLSLPWRPQFVISRQVFSTIYGGGANLCSGINKPLQLPVYFDWLEPVRLSCELKLQIYSAEITERKQIFTFFSLLFRYCRLNQNRTIIYLKLSKLYENDLFGVRTVEQFLSLIKTMQMTKTEIIWSNQGGRRFRFRYKIRRFGFYFSILFIRVYRLCAGYNNVFCIKFALCCDMWMNNCQPQKSPYPDNTVSGQNYSINLFLTSCTCDACLVWILYLGLGKESLELTPLG